jgi:hypothetical protein
MYISFKREFFMKMQKFVCTINSIRRWEPLNHNFLGITIYTTFHNCHAWVIDGYMRRRKTLNGVNFDYSYIHNNWGWYGKGGSAVGSTGSNGYFPIGVFNSNLTPLSSGTTKSNQPFNYQYSIKIVPYIYK